MTYNYLIGWIVVALLVFIFCMALYDFAWRKGHKNGFCLGVEHGRHEGKSLHAAECYEKGRRDADNWWIRADNEIAEHHG